MREAVEYRQSISPRMGSTLSHECRYGCGLRKYYVAAAKSHLSHCSQTQSCTHIGDCLEGTALYAFVGVKCTVHMS